MVGEILKRIFFKEQSRLTIAFKRSIWTGMHAQVSPAQPSPAIYMNMNIQQDQTLGLVHWKHLQIFYPKMRRKSYIYHLWTRAVLDVVRPELS